MLGMGYAAWSEMTLRRLEGRGEAERFLAFVHGLPAGTADEALAQEGAGLYRAALHRLRAAGLSLLQPGRLLMPAPGGEAPWMGLFPMRGSGGLAGLMGRRYEAYCAAVRRELAGPVFASVDRMVVLADVLSVLHQGEAAFGDMAAALGSVAAALRWRQAPGFVPGWLARLLPLRGIGRVAFVASKADHVAARQRGNLAALVGDLTQSRAAGVEARCFAVAAMRCTEDFVWTLEGRPVSAVRGVVAGQGMVASYPGEVPDRRPDAGFWAYPFLQIPAFEPVRLPAVGMPQIGLDGLVDFLLGDVL